MDIENKIMLTVCDRTIAEMAQERETPLSFREVAEIAHRLDDIRVDVIDLPEVTRPLEETVLFRTITASFRNAAARIACSVSEDSAVIAADCVRQAKNASVALLVPMSTVLIEYTYHIKSKVLAERLRATLARLAELGVRAELILADISRAEEGFSKVVYEIAKAGNMRVTLSDDACNLTPATVGKYVKEAVEYGIPVFVCVPDTLHLAQATALAAVLSGATGVVTSTGGHTALPTGHLADYLLAKEKMGYVKVKFDLSLARCGIEELSRETPEGKSRDGGITADGHIRIDKETGVEQIRAAVESLGYELSPADMGAVTEEARRVLIAGKEKIGRRELEAIVATMAMQVPATYHLENYTVTTGSSGSPMAQVTLRGVGGTSVGVSTGDGPVSALFGAVEGIVGHHYELDDFQIQSLAEGHGAVGTALVKLRYAGKLFSGSGASTDILGASVRAYLNALNKIVYEEGVE